MVTFCAPEEVTVVVLLSDGSAYGFSDHQSYVKFIEILDIENSELEVKKLIEQPLEEEV